MELLIAFAFMCAVVEYKEYRSSKRIKLLSAQLKAVKRCLDDVHFKSKEMPLMKELLADALKHCQEAREFAAHTDAKLEGFLKEYEAMKFHKKSEGFVADYVEGL